MPADCSNTERPCGSADDPAHGGSSPSTVRKVVGPRSLSLSLSPDRFCGGHEHGRHHAPVCTSTARARIACWMGSTECRSEHGKCSRRAVKGEGFKSYAAGARAALLCGSRRTVCLRRAAVALRKRRRPKCTRRRKACNHSATRMASRPHVPKMRMAHAGRCVRRHRRRLKPQSTLIARMRMTAGRRRAGGGSWRRHTEQ